MRPILAIAGASCVAMGGSWFLQGAGLIHWPASSTMLDQRIWAVWGGLLALIGLSLIWWTRRR